MDRSKAAVLEAALRDLIERDATDPLSLTEAEIRAVRALLDDGRLKDVLRLYDTLSILGRAGRWLFGAALALAALAAGWREIRHFWPAP